MGSLLKHDIKHFGTLRQIWDYLEDRGEHIGKVLGTIQATCACIEI